MGASAAFAEAEDGGKVRCSLCPHACTIQPGKLGLCRTRRNDGGILTALTYGRIDAAADDPVEKKPLFHFRPGSSTFSVAAVGCNLVCPFCQNHSLSQMLRDGGSLDEGAGRRTPDEVVAAALGNGSASISFTYSEPILSFEFARDVAAVARPRGIDIVFVTNGQMNEEPARALAAFLAAANVDLKCFSAAGYAEVLGGRLDATLRTIEILAAAGVWVEITTLVVPGFNDGDEELAGIARFIAGVGRDIPWHVSRFHPAYRWLDGGLTPASTLGRAREIGRAEGLRHVYTGNLPGDDGEKTYCPACRTPVIDRRGYRIAAIALQGGRCANCGETIAGRELP